MLVLLLWMMIAPLALAQARRVLVVVDRTSPGVVARLRRELASMGLEVIVSSQDQDLRPSRSLGELVKRNQGAAVLRLRPGRGLIEVAVTDGTTGALVEHEQALQGAEILRDDGVVALRMAELLRASLLEAQTASTSPTASASSAEATPPAPPDAVSSSSAAPALSSAAPALSSAAPVAPPPPKPLDLAVRAGPAITVSPGGLGPMIHAKIGASRAVGARGRVVVDALLPLGPARLDATGGQLSIFTSMVSVGGRLFFTTQDAPLSGSVGAALGLLWGSFSAEAVAPYEARRQQTLAVVPQIRGEASRAVGEGWRLWGEVTAGRSLSPLSIRLPGKSDIAWGNLLATGALGVELGF
jgi:hypothetical protein